MSHQRESETEWIAPSPIPPESGWRQLHANPLVAALLYRKGFRDRAAADAFLLPGAGALPRPEHIPNLVEAVDRVAKALASGQTIGVFGDYDVDGVTSTAILTLALQRLAGDSRVIPILPERAEGYGLNTTAIREFRQRGVELVIAADCGSTDHIHAQQIRASGMDLVIIDHHRMRDAGPPGAITVSPQLGPDNELRHLTAAGLAWLFASALNNRQRVSAVSAQRGSNQYLDLAALGTIADVAPLAEYNRPIVQTGLQLIRQGIRPGIAALLQIANQSPDQVRSHTVSHTLAPRLNAAGRLESPKLALDLLLARDRQSAFALARQLEDVNARRRRRSAEVTAEVYAEITRDPGWRHKPIVTAAHDTWEAGIVGAVASRISDDLRRPVLLFRRADGLLSGSARSVEGFDLIASLASVDHLLDHYGGHSLAAGLTMREEHLATLESHLTATLATSGLTFPAPRSLAIAANLPASSISLETAYALRELEPFGRGNDEPLLCLQDATLLQYTAVGSDRTHLKLLVESGGKRIEAIAWQAAARSAELTGQRKIDLAGRLDINTWNGQERVQMVLEDFRTR